MSGWMDGRMDWGGQGVFNLEDGCCRRYSIQGFGDMSSELCIACMRIVYSILVFILSMLWAFSP